jgi:hypothetical protein
MDEMVSSLIKKREKTPCKQTREGREKKRSKSKQNTPQMQNAQ